MVVMKLGCRAGLLLATSASVASAGNGTRKIDIESDPSGAAVYLESVDKPAACAATPCTVDAPIGTTVIILRKDGYEPEFGQVSVPKKGKIKPFRFSLAGEFGTLVVDDARFTGATITIDGADRGVAPKRIDVEPTDHNVVITLNNKELFAGKIAVETGATVSIPATQPTSPAKVAAKPTTERPRAHETPPPSKSKSAVAPIAPPRKRTIAAGVVFDINFRQFRFRDAQANQPTQSETGMDMVGPTLEVWPMALLGSSRLAGLSLYGEFELSINHLDVINDATGMTTGAKTKWRNFEIDVRHSWKLGRGEIVPSAGFVRDQMGYNGDASTLPVGDYQCARVGVNAGIRFVPALAIYGSVEGRLALDNGPLGARLGGADVYGGKAAAGISARFGPIFVGLEGSGLYYRWTFSNSSVAAGARDLVESVALFAGAQY